MILKDSNLAFILDNLTERSLSLRASANACVAVEKRPIRTRVLGRVVNSKEFSEVAANLTNNIRHRYSDEVEESVVYDAFFEGLSVNREFSTLLLEAIEREKLWSDLLESGFKTVGGWLRAFWSKVFSSSHPATATVAKALLAGLSLGLTFTIFVRWRLQDTPLQIPLRFDVASVDQKVQLSVDTSSLPKSNPKPTRSAILGSRPTY